MKLRMQTRLQIEKNCAPKIGKEARVTQSLSNRLHNHVNLPGHTRYYNIQNMKMHRQLIYISKSVQQQYNKICMQLDNITEFLNIHKSPFQTSV